ncbi:Uncharacterised protein [Vibrio cholerae]|nr:Uncharacterised protein [Vibrio cholerae]
MAGNTCATKVSHSGYPQYQNSRDTGFNRSEMKTKQHIGITDSGNGNRHVGN